MKLLIQLTFNNGLGNLYCGAVELLHFANHYKNLGYDCELIFASNGSGGNNNKYIDFVEFEEIFDVDSFKIFNKIKKALVLKLQNHQLAAHVSCFNISSPEAPECRLQADCSCVSGSAVKACRDRIV